MNTRKQVLIMSGLLAVMLLLIGAYAAWYPYRAKDAQAEFDDQTAERGAMLFARNCRLCHGDVGEGGALGARLPAAPALHRLALQGFADSKQTLKSDVDMTTEEIPTTSGAAFKPGTTIAIDDERMALKKIEGDTLYVERGTGHTEAAPHSAKAPILILDAAGLADQVKLITNTVTCGRVGTAMPAWAQTQGGPLSDEQIRQLMTLITQGRWDLVKTEDNVEDKLATKILDPVSEDTISIKVSDVSVFNAKQAIRIGDERLRVDAVPVLTKDKSGNLPKDRSGILQVERGILGTTPLEHAPGDIIYNFPETSEPAINQSSCGQTARPPAPVASPTTIEPFEGQTVEVTAQNITYSTNAITVKTGGKIRLRLDNNDKGTDHNIGVYKSSTDLTPASPGSVGIIFSGVNVDDTVFDAPAAGTYAFRCDVHPTSMFGTFTVQ